MDRYVRKSQIETWPNPGSSKLIRAEEAIADLQPADT